MDRFLDLCGQPEPEGGVRVDLGGVGQEPLTSGIGEALDRHLCRNAIILIRTLEPLLVIGRLEATGKKGFVPSLKTGA